METNLMSIFSLVVALYGIVFSIFQCRSYKTELFNRFHSEEFSYIMLFTKSIGRKIMLILCSTVLFGFILLLFSIGKLLGYPFISSICDKDIDIKLIVGYLAVMLPLIYVTLLTYKRQMADIQTAKVIEMARQVKIGSGTRKEFSYITTNDDLVFHIMCLLDAIIKKEAPWGIDQKKILHKEKEELIDRLKQKKCGDRGKDKEINKQLRTLSKLFGDENFI